MSLGCRIDRQRPATALVAKPPQVVHAGDVIRVTVRQDEQIDPSHAVRDALLPQLLGGIHLNVQPIHDYMDACARSLVSRIGGGADVAIARDHRHALRGPCSQENDFHMHRDSRAELRCHGSGKFGRRIVARSCQSHGA